MLPWGVNVGVRTLCWSRLRRSEPVQPTSAEYQHPPSLPGRRGILKSSDSMRRHYLYPGHVRLTSEASIYGDFSSGRFEGFEY